jgi:3-oxoacyl-[acyl-carrier-protein] synthase-1
MLRLAGQALVQCAALLPKSAASVPVSIAVPSIPGVVGIDRKRFIERLALQADVPLAIASSLAHQDGRAGGLLALSDARDLLLRGAARYVIAGGVDSYRDANVLAKLDVARRVKTSSNHDAFVPGEAAALLLVTTRARAAEDGLDALATYSAAATAFEEGHLLSSTPYRGEALAAAVAQLVARGDMSAPVAEVYSSMNGEHHWGREWAVAYMRQRAQFDEAHEFHHPADAYGDIGAAAGPMLVALTVIGQRKRYRRSPALVYCSSDDGPRSALVVHQGA